MDSHLLTKFFRKLGFGQKMGVGQQKTTPSLKAKPQVFPRSSHSISRRDISKLALKVLYRLHDAEFQAYLVGGGVRDVLLGLHPKDFDVATNATPEQVSSLFRNSRLIGRRFRLVHVHFGGQIVEVATFRAQHPMEEQDPNLSRLRENGMIVRDNIYGTLEEDVWRRDFTVNALYYNIADYSLIDYVGGMKDLKDRLIRMIGDPAARFREDPVRMLRAIRFAAKLKFKIDPLTAKPFKEMAELISNVPGARLFDEYLKLFLSGHALSSFELLRQYHLFSVLFPRTEECLKSNMFGKLPEQFLINAFVNTDKRIMEEKSVAPPFLIAVILWFPILTIAKRKEEDEKISAFKAFFDAQEHILHDQRACFSIPRRLTQVVREIWLMQFRLQRRNGHRAHALHSHARFRASYDFLLLRVQSGDKEAEELADWWTQYIASTEEERFEMANSVKRVQEGVQGGAKKKKRRKRRRGYIKDQNKAT